MKKLTLLSILLLTFSNGILAQTLSETDRKTAVDYLKQTKHRLLDDVKGLSDAQLNFKESPDRWSIKQCMEHLALAETFIWGGVEQGVKAPANPAMKDSVKIKDEEIVKFVSDRSKKFQAPEFLQPTGEKLPTIADAEKSFKESRDAHIKYVETTKDDLRNHIIKHPAFGWIDSHQMILFMAAHTERHTKQIDQVKADPNFPKK